MKSTWKKDKKLSEIFEAEFFLRLSIFIEAWNINFWSLISNKPERNHNLVLVQLKEKPKSIGFSNSIQTSDINLEMNLFETFLVNPWINNIFLGPMTSIVTSEQVKSKPKMSSH